jgi:hypothetical protein
MKYTYTIEQDEVFESPREWCNLGTMACFHKRYRLGDEHNLSIEEVQEIADSKDYISLPVYMYDHGGITINTTGFSCPWDSGQLGIIFVSKEKVKEEYGVKRISSKMYKRIEQYLKNEVATYDQYLRGDVYYYVIKDEDGEIVDSCGGFYGEEDCISEAESQVKWLHENTPHQLELFDSLAA